MSLSLEDRERLTNLAAKMRRSVREEARWLVHEDPGHYTTSMLRRALVERCQVSKGEAYRTVQRMIDRGEVVLKMNPRKTRGKVRFYLGDAPQVRRSRARAELPSANEGHSAPIDPLDLPKCERPARPRVRTW